MTNRVPRRLRVPTEDGAALVEPPLSRVAELVAKNRVLADGRDEQLGLPKGFSQLARRALFAGGRFDDQAVPSDPESEVSRPVIMTGHQPTLFHPGVWFKNFLLSSIARHVVGNGVNLVIDNDVIRAAAIRVPSSQPSEALTAEIPFDVPSGEVPWEQRYLIEPQLFHSFPRRVRHAMEPLTFAGQRLATLLLDRLWPYAESSRAAAVADAGRIVRGAASRPIDAENPAFVSIRESIPRPGHCIAAARRRLEFELGLSSGDIEISSPFFTRHFAEFAQLLLARHQEFWAIHNSALESYRSQNRIRSAAHPVPELARVDDWYEVPLWLWSHGKSHRRRVFVRSKQGNCELTDQEGILIRSMLEKNANGASPFYQAEIDGVHIRPRALITTMYARLVLSDLFIHGIGGAKYDELTDEIIRRFFGVEPPQYLTATATFRLPIDRPQVTIEDVRDAAQRIRDVRYRPESFVGDPLVAREPAISQQLQSLAAEKREYVRAHALRRGSKEVFAGLDRLNRAMHELLRPVEEHLRREHARLVAEARRARVLGSREFSFVLFPEEYLVPRLLELARLPA
jgi:hypothetical protein